MKKILLLILMVTALGACASTEKKDMSSVNKLSREAQWSESEQWYANPYEDLQAE